MQSSDVSFMAFRGDVLRAFTLGRCGVSPRAVPIGDGRKEEPMPWGRTLTSVAANASPLRGIGV